MSRAAWLRTILRGCKVADSWQKLTPCDVLLVRGDADCGYTFQSKAYSPLVDTVGEMLSARGLRVRAVAIPYAQWVDDRAQFSPASYNRAAAAMSLLSMVVRLRGRDVRNKWLDRRLEEQWSAMLDLARPRYIVAINPEATLCRVARRMGAITYDLQHGVIDTGNYWYDERADENFARSDLPDGILCWDEASAAPLRRWAGRAGVEVHVIGHPWFSRFLRPRPDDALVEQELSAAVRPHSDRPTIMVSLQWGLGTYYYPQPEFNGVMVDALEQTIKMTADRYDWLLRLHPSQMRGQALVDVEQYLNRAFGGLDGVEWRRSSRMALPLALSRADLHITDCSSVVIEAGWLGIRSALLNPNLHAGKAYEKVYSYERSVGLAEVLPQNAESIVSWIATSLAASRTARLAPHYQDAVNEFVDRIAQRCRQDGAAPMVA